MALERRIEGLNESTWAGTRQDECKKQGLKPRATSAGTLTGVVLLPELVPPPDSAASHIRKRVAELVGEHEDLATVVGFVGKHVTEHGTAGGPDRYDGVAEELCDAAIGLAREGVGEHGETGSGAFFVGSGSLLDGAVVRVERRGTFQVRRGVFDPAETRVVKMGEDGGDSAASARFGAG